MQLYSWVFFSPFHLLTVGITPPEDVGSRWFGKFSSGILDIAY